MPAGHVPAFPRRRVPSYADFIVKTQWCGVGLKGYGTFVQFFANVFNAY
jgi:hypothetical protein